MKKHVSAGRIARYALFLGAACLLVAGVTFARYYQEVQGQGTGSVAAVALDLATGSGGAVDVTSQLRGMKPGDVRTVDFVVSNKKDGMTSEVAQSYSVSVETTGNLPLTFELASKGGSGADKYVTTPGATTGSGATWTGGVLPVGAATHTYKLTVTWPLNSANPALADEIDRVVLKIDAQQVAPQKSTGEVA